MTLTRRLGLLGMLLSSPLTLGCEAETSGTGGLDAANQCVGNSTFDWEAPDAEVPRTVYLDGSGSGVLSLDERVTDGWRVSLVSGDLPVPAVLQDGGVLATFAPGDRIQVTSYGHCQPFSGCKSFVIVRDARDGALVTARFKADAGVMPDFAAALGLTLTLEPTCSLFAERTDCFMKATETRYALRVGADQPVALQRHSHAAVVVGGRSYTAWLSAASIVTGEQPASGNGCLDQAAFWATGGVQFTIVP
jgi:hypothetical protein